MDLTIISYRVAQIAIMYNLLLFTVWLLMAKREGGAVSEVYVIIMALFAARFYGVAMGIKARSLRCGDLQDYYEFMDGFWWDFRLTPEAIVFIILAFVLTRRFVKSYLYSDPDYRRQNGNRKTDK